MTKNLLFLFTNSKNPSDSLFHEHCYENIWQTTDVFKERTKIVTLPVFH